jgi:hypothetical protein
MSEVCLSRAHCRPGHRGPGGQWRIGSVEGSVGNLEDDPESAIKIELACPLPSLEAGLARLIGERGGGLAGL